MTGLGSRASSTLYQGVYIFLLLIPFPPQFTCCVIMYCLLPGFYAFSQRQPTSPRTPSQSNDYEIYSPSNSTCENSRITRVSQSINQSHLSPRAFCMPRINCEPHCQTCQSQSRKKSGPAHDYMHACSDDLRSLIFPLLWVLC
jgi:hypothetical protein